MSPSLPKLRASIGSRLFRNATREIFGLLRIKTYCQVLRTNLIDTRRGNRGSPL